MWVQYLDGEDPLEEGMAIHSGIVACRIPWTEEPGGLQSIGSCWGPAPVDPGNSKGRRHRRGKLMYLTRNIKTD